MAIRFAVPHFTRYAQNMRFHAILRVIRQNQINNIQYEKDCSTRVLIVFLAVSISAGVQGAGKG
jgi:hypothetical protein